RILALGSAKRLNKMPDIPTIGEMIPGFEASGWFALVAPPATPAAIAARIGRDVDDILADADVVERMEEVGTYVRRMSTAELADYIKAQWAKWAPVVQQFGVAQMSGREITPVEVQFRRKTCAGSISQRHLRAD